MGKTMLVLFTVPLLAQADIKLDFTPVERLIAQRTVGTNDVDVEQIKAAAETLAMTAELNAQSQAAYDGTPSVDQLQDEKFRQLINGLTNVSALSE